MRDHFINRLTSLVEDNPSIVLITGDLGFGVLDDFQKKYPENFINAGVAEQNMTGIAAGMALEGKIVLLIQSQIFRYCAVLNKYEMMLVITKQM